MTASKSLFAAVGSNTGPLQGIRRTPAPILNASYANVGGNCPEDH